MIASNKAVTICPGPGGMDGQGMFALIVGNEVLVWLCVHGNHCRLPGLYTIWVRGGLHILVGSCSTVGGEVWPVGAKGGRWWGAGYMTSTYKNNHLLWCYVQDMHMTLTLTPDPISYPSCVALGALPNNIPCIVSNEIDISVIWMNPVYTVCQSWLVEFCNLLYLIDLTIWPLLISILVCFFVYRNVILTFCQSTLQDKNNPVSGKKIHCPP